MGEGSAKRHCGIRAHRTRARVGQDLPMRLVCSYCRRTIRADPKARITDVSHGMCEPCARHFDRLWSGISFEEYLDDLEHPVLVCDEDTRVVAMNAKLAALIGVDRRKTVGLTGGEAFACVRSRLPEGCGSTVGCRECTVRRTVEEVARTGAPRTAVAAYLDTPKGRVDLRISALPGKAGVVQVIIEHIGEPRRLRGDA
jgi:PAS domain-containing protein